MGQTEANIKILVKLYGSFRRFSDEKTPGLREMILPENSTVRELLEHLGAPEREVFVITINGTHAKRENLIHDNDVVVFVPPVGGG